MQHAPSFTLPPWENSKSVTLLWICLQWFQPRDFHWWDINQVVFRRRTQDYLNDGPYNQRLTGKDCCHPSVEGTQVKQVVAYLMKYAFKPSSMQDKQLSTRKESGTNGTAGQPSNISNPARDHTRDDLPLYFRARLKAEVKAAWELLEFKHARMISTAHAYMMQLENERNFINRNQTLPPKLGLLVITAVLQTANLVQSLYFFGLHWKGVTVQDTPRGLTSHKQSTTRDSGFPANYVVSRGDHEEDHWVARICFIHTLNAELFPLRQILLERNVSFFVDGRT